MNYNILFHPKASQEFLKLDGHLKKLVAKQLKKIESHPTLGKPLGNKAGIDLTGYRKLYVDNKKVRIIYEIIEEKITVFVIAIGKRNEMIVYRDAFNRKR